MKNIFRAKIFFNTTSADYKKNYGTIHNKTLCEYVRKKGSAVALNMEFYDTYYMTIKFTLNCALLMFEYKAHLVNKMLQKGTTKVNVTCGFDVMLCILWLV